MSCSSCGTNGNDKSPGCQSNGGCSNGACSHLASFNWLSGLQLPQRYNNFDVIEVRFKNGRKGYYRNIYNHSIYIGDSVAVEASPGHDIGIVSMTGELVKLQMKKNKVVYSAGDMKKVYRKSSQEDLDKWTEARNRESETMLRARKIAGELELSMKISDVEYQGDNSKATFFYTADDRVDFRSLIKKLADEFKVRIEMRQIGARQEAARLGGIGSCGRELCCSTWLTDFRSVSTSAARYQQLSLNPQKLAGQCGKLKCCLNYELDMYLEVYKDLPNTNVRLKSKAGVATHFKTDIFKRLTWYMIDSDEATQPFAISVDRVLEIQEMNKRGEFPENFSAFSVQLDIPEVKELAFENVVGQDDLTRFDNSKKNKKRPGKRRNPNQQKQNNQTQNNRKPGNKTAAQKQNGKPEAKQENASGAKPNKSRNQRNKGQNKNTPKPNPNATAATSENKDQVKTGPKKRRPQNKRKPNPNKGGENKQQENNNNG